MTATVEAAPAPAVPAAPAYKYLAARQAYETYGKSYADCIEAHTAELVAKGHDIGDRDLGQALMGNDGE